MTAGDRGANILFVTWDAPGAPYLESLFLPIFVALGKAGYRFHVLQFSWGDDGAPGAACANAGIPYRRVRVIRRPVAAASLASAVAGSRNVRRAVADWHIDLLLPRSYLPALAANLARTHKPILLDADGLPNDERREFGGSDGIVASLLDRLEVEMVRRSDRLITRTERAVDVLHERTGMGVDRFDVVPNGRSRSVFTPLTEAQRVEGRKALGIDELAPVIAYVGTSLGWKNRADVMGNFVRAVAARRDDTAFLVLSGSGDEVAAFIQQHGDLAGRIVHRSVPANDVARHIALADVGLAPMHDGLSLRGVAPIKIGEYLLCGVPVLMTRRIGDFDQLLERGTGWTFGGGKGHDVSAATEWFCNEVLTERGGYRERCRRLGEERFSLEAAEMAYRNAMKKALG